MTLQELHDKALAALTDEQRAKLHPQVLANLLPLPTSADECRVIFGAAAVEAFQRGVARAVR